MKCDKCEGETTEETSAGGGLVYTCIECGHKHYFSAVRS